MLQPGVRAGLPNGSDQLMLPDIIDTQRSLRLEIIVVILIAFEIVIGAYDLYARSGH